MFKFSHFKTHLEAGNYLRKIRQVLRIKPQNLKEIFCNLPDEQKSLFDIEGIQQLDITSCTKTIRTVYNIGDVDRNAVQRALFIVRAEYGHCLYLVNSHIPELAEIWEKFYTQYNGYTNE